MDFHNLPETLIGNVMNYLQLDERFRLYTVCTSIWKRREVFNRHLCCIKVTSSSNLSLFSSSLFSNINNTTSIQNSWCNIVELDIGCYGTDDMLLLLGNSIKQKKKNNDSDSDNNDDNDTAAVVYLPNLTKLSMVSSNEITDYGLFCLCKRKSSLLQYIDITFCSQTTYTGTFPIRDEYPDCIIRRQPKWMDGKFITPFHKDGEAHIYWCDGTFMFEREQQSCGYVSSLHYWSSDNKNHVGDKLQYTNFVPPLGWPDWSRFCYRPGVSLLRLENDSDSDSDERRVLVGQNLYGIHPPQDYPKYEHRDIVPVNTSRYFSRQNQLLGDEDAEEDQKFVMVSCMKVLPLTELMPPDHLVQKNRNFCKELKVCGQTLQQLDHREEFLHYVLTSNAPS